LTGKKFTRVEKGGNTWQRKSRETGRNVKRGTRIVNGYEYKLRQSTGRAIVNPYGEKEEKEKHTCRQPRGKQKETIE